MVGPDPNLPADIGRAIKKNEILAPLPLTKKDCNVRVCAVLNDVVFLKTRFDRIGEALNDVVGLMEQLNDSEEHIQWVKKVDEWVKSVNKGIECVNEMRKKFKQHTEEEE